MIIVLVLLGEAEAHARSLSASAVAAEIRATSASIALRKYYDTPAWSKIIIPGIESGAPAWLNVAKLLRITSDGAAAEDLDLALYAALTVAPFRVLSVLTNAHRISIEDLCDVSFEARVPKPGVSASEYLSEIRSKLAKARTHAEKAMAASCSRGLDRSMATLKASDGR